MAKYRRNFILCDSVIYYCLICDELLAETTNVEKHIRWENHRKNLKNQTYFPKFRKDFIYKVENHFYCEVCNVIVSDIDSATEHVNNDEHKAMKSNPITETKIFGQYDCGSIIINQLKLNLPEWNSIIDSKCFICDTDVPYDKLHAHMSTKEHIIHLINSESICKNEHYYRKINNDKYHCFTCKKIYSTQELNDHLLSLENIDESPTEEEDKEDDEDVTEVSVRWLALQDYVWVDNTENLPTFSEQGLETFTNEAGGSGTNGLSKKKKSREIIDHGKRRHELSEYGKQNSIKLIQCGRNGWCMLCDRYLSPFIKVFEEHVIGSIHQGNLELQGLINPKEHDTRSITKKSILYCNPQYSSDNYQIYVLSRWCIDIFSFFLISQVEDKTINKTKCFACNELFPQGQEREHCSTQKHKTKLYGAEVVTTFEKEGHFIREIRKNFFHCGFCNKTIPFLEQVYLHFVTTPHKMKKVGRTGSGSGLISFNFKTDDVYDNLLSYSFRNNLLPL